jgi:hypothetical protein
LSAETKGASESQEKAYKKQDFVRYSLQAFFLWGRLIGLSISTQTTTNFALVPTPYARSGRFSFARQVALLSSNHYTQVLPSSFTFDLAASTTSPPVNQYEEKESQKLRINQSLFSFPLALSFLPVPTHRKTQHRYHPYVPFKPVLLAFIKQVCFRRA